MTKAKANESRLYTDADYRAMMPGTPASVAQTLVAWHGDPKIKQKYLKRVKAHAEADEIVHGTYWEDGKGCAVGCTIHSGDHARYETEMGIPRVLARLEDGIFESLPNGESKAWPEKFLAAIEPGTRLGMVWPKFAVWILTDAKWGTIQYAKTDAVKKSIQAVADAYQSVIDGTAGIVDWRKLQLDCRGATNAANAAANAAADAAAYAAYAANAAANAAADAAAYAAADAAADAADAANAAYAAANAAYAAANAAAKRSRIEARIAQSKKLLELLSEAE